MSTPIIIQINNVKALERLLGDGEDNFAMAVRNSVAQAFANRHFNALEKTPEIQEAIQEAKRRAEVVRATAENHMKAAIGEELGTFTRLTWGRDLVFSLSDEIKGKIKNQVFATAEDLVQAEVKRVVEEYNIPDTIKKAVDRKINAVWAASIDTEVNKRLNEIKKLI